MHNATLKEVAEIFNEYKKMHERYNERNSFNGMLYHYTKWKGLEGILTSQSIRYTDYRYLNDPLEISYAYQTITEEVQEHRKSHRVDSFANYFWTRVQSALDDVNNTLSVSDAQEKTEIYTCSFCEEPDYLPAWRWYGDNGRGFAIGFYDEVKKAESIIQTPTRIAVKMCYEKEVLVNFIKDFIGLADKRLLFYEITFDQNKLLLFSEQLIAALLSATLLLLPGFKVEDYKSEKEIRGFIIRSIDANGKVYPEGNSDLKIQTLENINKQEYTDIPAEFIIKSQPNNKFYYAFNFDKEKLKEIHVGPFLNFDIVKDRIERILSNNKYDVKNITIKQVDIPYQN